MFSPFSLCFPPGFPMISPEIPPPFSPLVSRIPPMRRWLPGWIQLREPLPWWQVSGGQGEIFGKVKQKWESYGNTFLVGTLANVMFFFFSLLFLPLRCVDMNLWQKPVREIGVINAPTSQFCSLGHHLALGKWWGTSWETHWDKWEDQWENVWKYPPSYIFIHCSY